MSSYWVNAANAAMLTDLYELTMLESYFAHGMMADDHATIEKKGSIAGLGGVTCRPACKFFTVPPYRETGPETAVVVVPLFP